MIQDLHSHTFYSFCGADTPEQVVEAAIKGGVELLGICDHNYGIAYGRLELLHNAPAECRNYERTLERYFDHIDLVRRMYSDKIKLLRGIEIFTADGGTWSLPEGADISYFDYCLIEHLNYTSSMTGGDLFSFAKRCGCPTGIAHTDMFTFIESKGFDALEYFTRMAEEGIFWEMNVNYDSIHGYNQHAYVKDFFASEEKQDIIRRSGVKLSVGFDGHRVGEYAADIVKDCCERIEALGIPLAFSE